MNAAEFVEAVNKCLHVCEEAYEAQMDKEYDSNAGTAKEHLKPLITLRDWVIEYTKDKSEAKRIHRLCETSKLNREFAEVIGDFQKCTDAPDKVQAAIRALEKLKTTTLEFDKTFDKLTG